MANEINANFSVDEVRDLSNEELGALLRGSGLDIRQLAKEAMALKKMKESADPEAEETKPAKKESPFELTLAKYPDFAITKRTPKTEQLLVVMPSCGGYYIKTTKNGAESIDELTRESYSKFSAGMEPIKMPEDFWLETVNPGVAFYDALERLTKKMGAVDAIKNHCFPKSIFRNMVTDKHYTGLVRFVTMYNEIPVLVKDFHLKYPNLGFWNENRYKEPWMFLRKMQEVFGIENTRDFIESIQDSLVDFDAIDSYQFSDEEWLERFFAVPMKYVSFKDYVLYSAYTMGYGDIMSTFFHELKDAWDMEIALYGKIKEKYPENLPTYHQQLSFKARLKKKEIDDAKMTHRAIELEYYNMNLLGFTFSVPQSGADMLDEAGQQANCLAGYIDKYANGETDIVFMRKKDTPETSYVTIEVKGGKIAQAYYARNKILSAADREVVDKWFAAVQKRLEKNEQIA